MDKYLKEKKAAAAKAVEDEDFEIVDEDASDNDASSNDDSSDEEQSDVSAFVDQDDDDDSDEDEESDEEEEDTTMEDTETSAQTNGGEQHQEEDDDDDEDDDRDTTDENKQAKVQVKFFTKLEGQFDVPESAFFVPVSLSRLGLSTVLNHILSQEKPQPFDFLIKDEFLRVPIEKYLKKNDLSADDTVLDLEFTLALTLPKQRDQVSHEDWVSCVRPAFLSTTNQEVAYTGSYDGFVRLWDLKNKSQQDNQLEAIGTFRCHTKAIKAIAVVQTATATSRYPDVLTTALDHKMLLWNSKMLRSKENPEVKVLKMLQRAEFVGHTGQLESISLSPSRRQFCAAGWDHKVHFWELDELDEVTQVQPSALEPENKRPKRTVPNVAAALSLSGHSDRVSSVCWHADRTCVSASWDNTIRIWDIPSAIATSILRGKKAVNCMDFSGSTGLIVSGHADNLLRLWDPRSKEGELVRQQFRSHKGIVSDVKWHPENDFQFASASLDGTARVWDTRSSVPLFTLRSHTDKVLCVNWNLHDNKEQLLSGSADRQLHLHLLKEGRE
eukprot:CAMPEP_0184368600 /NCGR_PEP_ID=MMETSP1089-20130417/161757_1 /TAXON_ID=38269 ORGANISM="Gloeochaete wittrockiana, Strain SAG46.84" /NCGR_SAMPLE_ID=MMETSP1089 /ASSEMBLY_ACC=CAM_ASM_000445 /LENGTH=553 /DNA_ID=CAMNT_0026710909 /DNA_START=78 /DNA_END=1739 /DNA_ORIENTATION=+